MDQSSKAMLRKIIIDFLCLFVVGMGVLMFFLYGKPYKRGFFCNDESLYHPFHESTVTNTILYIVGFFLPISGMLIGEYIHASFSNEVPKLLCGYNIPVWFSNSFHKIGIFGFGAVMTVFLTDTAKYTIGRLRPHFMTLCVPNVNCSLIENRHRYIEDFTCTATTSPKLLKDVRLSFPSGHSSFAFYTMIYLAANFIANMFKDQRVSLTEEKHRAVDYETGGSTQLSLGSYSDLRDENTGRLEPSAQWLG
ncbi:putative phosphatidate phosphatase isoform X4 [Hylaeus volcanicus]|uniref:putative phosphatidate phosphatase isoform X4 n=1 Tax=Hylaeus volcanicus TaxID=313075 RepID=UPI0023B7AE28|nr:putative phosphatidate phosphatase isoform X4 [Hylaeus volcanicus]